MKKNGGDQMDTLKILVVDDESRMRKLAHRTDHSGCRDAEDGWMGSLP